MYKKNILKSSPGEGVKKPEPAQGNQGGEELTKENTLGGAPLGRGNEQKQLRKPKRPE